LARLPVWAFHGAQDDIVPVEHTLRMVRALQQLGALVRVTVYPSTGHDAWTPAYRNPALYAWLSCQRRHPGRRGDVESTGASE
jgi:dipeptidyl aminopeptidase/acylaminoacyl peptidase